MVPFWIITSVMVLSFFVNEYAAQRISEQKCAEYSENIRAFGESEDYFVSRQFDINRYQAKCKETIVPFIVHGRDAQRGEYPYQVEIGYDSKTGILWKCGGGLISQQFVITAAHCVLTEQNIFPTHVLVGDIRLSDEYLSKTRLVVGISETYVNPNYTPPTKYNDIALIKLDRNLSFSEDVRPGCLVQNERDLENHKTLTVAGWGLMKADDTLVQANALQSVNLTLWDKADCTKYYTDGIVQRRYPDGIIESQICAGDPTGERDSCEGDSGSPIVYRNPDKCNYYIAGVTHGGSKICGENQPAIYTNVTSYLDWIESIVWPNHVIEVLATKINESKIEIETNINNSKITTPKYMEENRLQEFTSSSTTSSPETTSISSSTSKLSPEDINKILLGL